MLLNIVLGVEIRTRIKSTLSDALNSSSSKLGAIEHQGKKISHQSKTKILKSIRKLNVMN